MDRSKSTKNSSGFYNWIYWWVGDLKRLSSPYKIYTACSGQKVSEKLPLCLLWKIIKTWLRKAPESFLIFSWTRWCNQILSSLHYMHSLQTPTVHGNLTTDTIFLQHHGLLKIGCFSIDTIRCYAKSETAKNRNMKVSLFSWIHARYLKASYF